MNATPEKSSSRALRRAMRQRAKYLVTADEHSLVELEVFLTTLPMCATGRVFIEVAEEDQVRVMSAPQRMTVTWLVRARRSGAAGTCRPCTPGTALARAVCAWADEMLCDGDEDTSITLFGGFLGTADIVDHLTEKCHIAAEQIYAPERFGLLARAM